jgi:hypothetical protein
MKRVLKQRFRNTGLDKAGESPRHQPQPTNLLDKQTTNMKLATPPYHLQATIKCQLLLDTSRAKPKQPTDVDGVVVGCVVAVVLAAVVVVADAAVVVAVVVGGVVVAVAVVVAVVVVDNVVVVVVVV